MNNEVLSCHRGRQTLGSCKTWLVSGQPAYEQAHADTIGCGWARALDDVNCKSLSQQEIPGNRTFGRPLSEMQAHLRHLPQRRSRTRLCRRRQRQRRQQQRSSSPHWNRQLHGSQQRRRQPMRRCPRLLRRLRQRWSRRQSQRQKRRLAFQWQHSLSL